jgi:hypothetical protein
LGSLGHVGIEVLLLVCLARYGGVELAHPCLEGLDDVSFELSKVLLDRKEIVTRSVLLGDLFREAVVDAALEEVRVGAWVWLVGVGGGAIEVVSQVSGAVASRNLLIASSMLSQQLNMLHSLLPRLIRRLRTLTDPFLQLLALLLDLAI